MNDSHWFKLLVRGIGVLLIGLAIPSVIALFGTAAMVANAANLTGNPSMDQWVWVLSGILGTLAQLGFGVNLLFGAPRLVRYCLRQVNSRCGACDYDVRGLRGVCPECGATIPEKVHPGHEQVS